MNLNAMLKKKKKERDKKRKESKENVYIVFWFLEAVETIY